MQCNALVCHFGVTCVSRWGHLCVTLESLLGIGAVEELSSGASGCNGAVENVTDHKVERH
eukprot:14959856-Heterocapsa_arctica.AAC.1